MQDVRGHLPRRSSGSLAADASQLSHELPVTLRTNPLLYPGPISPERRKLAFHFVGGTPQCPEHQPRGPFTPPGAAISGSWLPFSAVPLPAKLVFETWWHEGPHRRVAMHVTYDAATRRCTAGTYVSVDMEVTTPAGEPIDEYDLHVGAEVRVAGRRVTLRKPLTLATQMWLDQQARAMLISKYRLEQEINKFRPVVPVPAQYTDPKRTETMDFGSHQHMPTGGRLSLRALFDTLLQLTEQLRQHRVRLPPLPEGVSERVSTAAVLVGSLGPPDWSPERREAERREAEARQREALESARPQDDCEWRNDLTHWLDSIPLAASCCSSYSAVTRTGPHLADSLRDSRGEKELLRSAGQRGGRSGAAGLFASAAAAAGVHITGGGSATLAFNLNVISKLAAMASGAAAAGGLGGAGGGGVGGAAAAGSAAGAGVAGTGSGAGGAGAGGAGGASRERGQSPAGAMRPPVLAASGSQSAPQPSAAVISARQL